MPEYALTHNNFVKCHLTEHILLQISGSTLSIANNKTM